MTGQCYRCGGWHTQATACPANQPSTAPGWYAGNVKYYAVVMQQDYDALAARLAEAEALLREALYRPEMDASGNGLCDCDFCAFCGNAEYMPHKADCKYLAFLGSKP